MQGGENAEIITKLMPQNLWQNDTPIPGFVFAHSSTFSYIGY